eukprot:scaffold40_cov66-Phaeocystis_antarctica.AAC.13
MIATKTSLCRSEALWRSQASGALPKAIALPRKGIHDQTTGGSPGYRRFCHRMASKTTSPTAASTRRHRLSGRCAPAPKRKATHAHATGGS